MAFLRRCREALRENGIIVIKDNLNSKQGFYVDKEDNSITRSAFHYASSSSLLLDSLHRRHWCRMTTGPTGTCVGCSRRPG